jgi:hypothetical protein
MFFSKPKLRPDRASARLQLFEDASRAASEAVAAGIDRRDIAGTLEDIAQTIRATDSMLRPIL